MRLRAWREGGIWILALISAVALMSWNPSPLILWGQVPDFLFAVQLFAAYFYRAGRSLAVCLAAGFLRDLLYGLILGPDMLCALLIHILGSCFLSEKFNRSPWWIYPQALWIYPLSRLFRSVIFALIPVENIQRMTLTERMSESIRYTLRSFPGMLIALSLVLLLLAYLLPPVRGDEGGKEEIALSEEHGPLW